VIDAEPADATCGVSCWREKEFPLSRNHDFRRLDDRHRVVARRGLSSAIASAVMTAVSV
jgi:hypothetical protein